MSGIKTQEECRHDILLRLKKIEGQIRGLSRMVEENRECKDIVIQLAAVKAAITQVGAGVLSGHLRNGLGEELLQNQALQDHLEEFNQLLKKWF